MINIPTHWKTAFRRTALLLIVGSLTVLVGCVQKVPVAYFARAGDTIILGLGGIQRNTKGATNLQSGDLQLTITNTSTNAVSTLTTGKTFKAFPDYNSGLTYQAINGSLAALVPFDGGWFVTTTLPNDGSLPPGSYTISITSPTNKLVNTKFNYIYAEGDLTQIPLQIVAGTGGNADYDSQFTYYPTVSGGRLDVSPSPAPASVGINAIGGLQLVITFPTASYSATLPLIALPYSHNPSIQLAQNTVDNGNGTKSLVVLLSAAQGFVARTSRTTLTPVLEDTSLSFFYRTASGIGSNATQQLGDFKIDFSRSHYYDASGNVIASLQPAMTFQ